MSKIVKNIIALSVSSALSISFIHNVNAATYNIIDTGAVSNLKYTYAQHQNTYGDMAISGANLYNIPVQFESSSGEKYLDEDDFAEIILYALNNYQSINSLTFIENIESLLAGDPTANDLSWVTLWLQNSKGTNIEYQKISDTLAITRVGSITEALNLWDEKFDGTDDLTRSTVDIVRGITDGDIVGEKITYGTGSAPYLPQKFTDSDDEEHVFWLREHGIRGFYSYNQGAVHQVTPIETGYGGGESAVLDVNEEGLAVGYSSYKLAQAYQELIESDSGGCADTSIVPDQMTFEACIAQAKLQSSSLVYHTMAFKATLDPNGNPVVEQLGLLVEPHEDDERAHSSYALAVNASGVAVGYAGGWDDETVITPTVSQSSNYQYAVVYKNDEVIDLTGDHSNKAGSIAYDINDDGIAVGQITKVISGTFVQKFFHIDTTVPEAQMEMFFPSDFFNDSDSIARAINNNGLIVGEGEVETHNESSSNPRRTAAFVYDINAKTFSNLNDLIPCSKRLTYDIFEARGINEQGVISASAIVKVDRIDAKGEPMLDDNGSALREDVVRAISLEFIPGGDGEICTPEEEGKVIRKGAGFGLGSLFALMFLFGLRHKFMK